MDESMNGNTINAAEYYEQYNDVVRRIEEHLTSMGDIGRLLAEQEVAVNELGYPAGRRQDVLQMKYDLVYDLGEQTGYLPDLHIKLGHKIIQAKTDFQDNMANYEEEALDEAREAGKKIVGWQ